MAFQLVCIEPKELTCQYKPSVGAMVKRWLERIIVWERRHFAVELKSGLEH